MSLVDFSFISVLLSQNIIKRFEILPENQNLRKYYGNVIATFYGDFNTYLSEVKYDPYTNAIYPPEILMQPFVCVGNRCCFELADGKVCQNNPKCLTEKGNDKSRFCQIHGMFCKDLYSQYKYVCESISNENGEIISKSQINVMTDEELNYFIDDAKNCYDARQQQLSYCPSYNVQKHKGYMVVLEIRIRNALEEKIHRRMGLDSPIDRSNISEALSNIDTSTLISKIYELGFPPYIDLNVWFSRKYLEYLYLMLYMNY